MNETDEQEAQRRQLRRGLLWAMLIWPAYALYMTIDFLLSPQTPGYFKALLALFCFAPIALLWRWRERVATLELPRPEAKPPLDSPGAQPSARARLAGPLMLAMFAVSCWILWSLEPPAAESAAPAERLADGQAADALDEDGYSGLMRAAFEGDMTELERLLQAGAQVDLRQSVNDAQRGDTALLRACYGGQLAAAQRLVQAGASLKARNRWDWGPVHMAAQSGCVECLQWLASQGESLSEPAPASRGETPAMLAAARDQVAVLVWLEAQGVDLGLRDPHGKTALDWAQFGQAKEAERWLLQRKQAPR